MSPPYALGPGLLCALRLLPLCMTSPFLGGPLAPVPARAALALGLGAAVARLCGARPPDGPWPLAAAAAAELAAGVVLAFLASIPVEAARAAGRLADTYRGATLAELHVPQLRQRESASGDLLAQWVVVLAAWGGADRLLLRGLLWSFAALPPGGALAPFTAGAGELALRAGSELVACAVAVSAPAAAGVLAADLVLTLAARASPALSASGAAAPARAVLGLALLAASASAAAGRLVGLLALPAGLVASLPGAGP